VPDLGGDVLIVEDDHARRECVATLIETRGHCVRRASRGLEALELASAGVPDLMLIDVELPDVDGFEVCRRLRTRWSPSELPVLLVSDDDGGRARGFQLGAVGYVKRPFQPDEMVARVETHLELRRVQKQATERARELEALNARLGRLEEARSTFFSAVVHDLKNSLTPVLKNAEWLLSQSHSRLRANDDSDDVLRDLSLAAHHMNRMVVSLLDVARGGESDLLPRLEAVNLLEWLDEAASLARMLLRSTPRRLLVDAEAGVAWFDRTLMKRVVQNLLDNAIKYSAPESNITVRARVLAGGELQLIGEDGGPGIPGWARQRIFEPWVRVEQGEDPHGSSSHGLGLAFCHQAIRAHGGRIFVEDAAPHGARFVIELPGPPPAFAAR
jgi:two-component system, sensor histidine kinase and response regulator